MKTYAEIMNMQPGIDLDKLVTEKVMGYEYFVDDQNRLMARRDFAQRGYYFNPSTEIAAAWEVLDKMGHAQINKKVNGEYVVRWDNKRWTDSPVCQSKSAPEAICKAALLSLIQEDTP